MDLHIVDSIRTNNFEDPHMAAAIGALWQRSAALLEGYEGNVYGVYHEYISNYKGDYQLSIAVQSPRNGEIIQVKDEQLYQVFPVDPQIEHGIFKVWQTIWALEEAGQLQRAYTVDFEKYTSTGDIDIYISIK